MASKFGDCRHTFRANPSFLSASENKRGLGIGNKKCAKQVNVLGRLSYVLNAESKLKIVDSFICSNLRYCGTVYHYCNKSDCSKLEKLFERALRYVFN